MQVTWRWIHPCHWHHWWHWRQWRLTVFQTSTARRIGTWQLNAGPLTVVRSFAVTE